MDERTTGLVLRLYPLTETSLIVHWLTQTVGRLSTVAKGARRAKSPFHGKLDLFYLAELSFSRSRRSDLHTLREVRLVDPHTGLRSELGYLRQASYGAALIGQATETETPIPAIFDLMSGFLNHLPAHPPAPKTLLAFESKLLGELGLQPDLAKTRLSAGGKQLIKALAESEWRMLPRLKLSQAQVKELDQFLHGFLVFHLGRIPPGRAAALQG
jgi:DNA repair protein RecO (recombination protein O)